MPIQRATTDDEILRCFPVMHQLRPHLLEAEFVATIRAQEEEGFQLAMLSEGGTVQAVAGFRVQLNLVAGKVLYVDDLVTDSAARSLGAGKAMLDWLTALARAAGCKTLELDSGVHRFGAHRFYLTNRMEISSHHFRLNLS